MSERRTDDATLIAAVRTLARTIQTDDGLIDACLAEAAARLEALVKERRWISVGERLPENAQRVWAFVPAIYGAQEAQWVDGHWRDHFGRVGRPVTHWQPLPPGPEDAK